MGKIKAGKTLVIPTGKLHKISIEEKEILVVNIYGNYFAVDDTCTYVAASLSEGKLDGSTVTCDWHCAQFDCNTGKLEKFSAKINDLKSYKILVESDDVFVEV